MTEQMDPTLPAQTPGTREEKIIQVHDQQALLTRLREQADATGDKRLAAQGDALQAQYYANDMAALDQDVYRSAAGEQAPKGLGYLRASQHPEQLRKLGVDWTDAQVAEYLKPNGSDFRAEIYLPDPAVHGRDAKPVIVFKGSNGQVTALDENKAPYKRESALEDWVENFRQGLGQKSDHYNRAMDLATALQKDYRRDFDIGGHSKGGGMALAASAVTGMPSYTFNAASLHAETAQRYVREHGGTVSDVGPLNHGYFVKGEVLHDGLNLVRDMNVPAQEQLAETIRQASELSQLPAGRQMLQSYLEKTLHYDETMQRDAMALVDDLAARANGGMLQQVPGHAGLDHLVELAPKTRNADGALVDRPFAPNLAMAQVAASPLLDALHVATTLGVAGKHAGETVAAGGQALERGLHAVGSTTQAGWNIVGQVEGAGSREAGKVVGATVRYGGEVLANARLAGGHFEAATDRQLAAAAQWGNGLTGRLLRSVGMDEAAQSLDRATDAYATGMHTQAERALASARHDADGRRHVAGELADDAKQFGAHVAERQERTARQIGTNLGAAYGTVGASVRTVTDLAPTFGAAQGLQVGGTYVIGRVVTDPLMVAGAAMTKMSGTEAATRHGQADVVQPSMDARTRTMESAILKRLQEPQPAREAPALPVEPHGAATPSTSLPAIDNPRHAAFPLYQGAERGVHAQDARVGRTSDIHSKQLAGSLAAEMHAAGGRHVDQVVMSQDARVTFGVQGKLEDPAHLRVGVDTMTAMQTPLVQSTQRIADNDMQQTQIRQQALLQPQPDTGLTGPRLG